MFKKEPVIVARTEVRCNSCGNVETRPHRAGDAVFAGVDCRCGRRATIAMIYGEHV